MRASVIVVSHNSHADLPGCLLSIQQQLTPADELIVVDNGSTDNSVELVEAHYPWVRLIRNDNLGYAGGTNRGVREAKGKYLVILNPDTMLTPGALTALLAPLQSGTANALTTACITYMHQPDTVNTCGNEVHYTGLTYCRGAGRPRTEYGVAGEVTAVSGAAFAIRRAVFEELGGFDEQFFMYVEDTDLSWRARLAGYRCLYVPQAVVRHAYQLSYSPSKAFYLDRNRHIMLLKNLSWATYARMIPGLLLGEAVTWGFLLLQGPDYWTVKVKVYGWLWTERRSILQRRQGVQRSRRRTDQEIVGQLTYRLAFEQLAQRHLAWIAELLFHPLFWAARYLFTGGRA